TITREYSYECSSHLPGSRYHIDCFHVIAVQLGYDSSLEQARHMTGDCRSERRVFPQAPRYGRGKELSSMKP
ncbi:hypothetical protein Pmani_012462, partial [Petrolisthes manimaculis]